METRAAYIILAVLLFSMIPSGAFPALSPQAFGGTNFSLYPGRAPANDMALRDMSGSPVSLSRLVGRVTLLNFWRIDCPACNYEKPILERLYRRYAPRGLVVVAVNLFDDYTRINQYRIEGQFTFPIAFDPEKRFRIQTLPTGRGGHAAYVVNGKSEAIYELSGVPATYVMDRHGRIVGHGVGMLNWETAPLSELIEELIREPGPVVGQPQPLQTKAVSGPRPPLTRAGPVRAADGPQVARLAAPAAAGAGGGGKEASTSAYGVPQAPEIFEEEPARLPFQGADEMKAPKAGAVSVKKPKAKPAPGVSGDAPGESVKKTAPRVKTEPKHVPDKTPARVPAAQPPSAKGGKPTQAKSAPPVPPAAVSPPVSAGGAPAPVPVPASPTFPGGLKGSGVRSSLPEAMPYSSPHTGGAQDLRPVGQGGSGGKAAPAPRGVVPDKDGYVTAQVPPPAAAAPPQRTRPERVTEKQRSRADNSKESLEGFLLESVQGRNAPDRIKAAPAPPEGARSGGRSSWFTPLKRISDGIQESVSQVLPGPKK
jgi:thiol-disulfide isomerase/thioredoxin